MAFPQLQRACMSLHLHPPPSTPQSSIDGLGPVALFRTPGTCGELLQGALDGQDFMVNCPIDLYASAAAVATPGAGVSGEALDNFGKAAATVRLLLARRGLAQAGLALRLHSAIPRGKGMASSSADAGAALGAAAACLGLRLPEAEAAQLLTSVEPSDCTVYSGIAHLNFLTGKLFEQLPVPAGLRVLVLDAGGQVETLQFDRARARAVYAQAREPLAHALQRLLQGLRSGQLSEVGAAATTSTELSQRILPKPVFTELQAARADWPVLGINCAHSGTVLGLLYAEAPERGAQLRHRVQSLFGNDLQVLGDHQVIGGGSHAG